MVFKPSSNVLQLHILATSDRLLFQLQREAVDICLFQPVVQFELEIGLWKLRQSPSLLSVASVCIDRPCQIKILESKTGETSTCVWWFSVISSPFAAFCFIWLTSTTMAGNWQLYSSTVVAVATTATKKGFGRRVNQYQASKSHLKSPLPYPPFFPKFIGNHFFHGPGGTSNKEPQTCPLGQRRQGFISRRHPNLSLFVSRCTHTHTHTRPLLKFIAAHMPLVFSFCLPFNRSGIIKRAVNPVDFDLIAPEQRK